MSIPEILATMSQDLVNSSSSIPVKGRDVKAEMDNYFSESLKTPTFLKLAMIHLLSSSKTNSGDLGAFVDELEQNANEMVGKLLVCIRRGLAPPCRPSAAKLRQYLEDEKEILQPKCKKQRYKFGKGTRVTSYVRFPAYSRNRETF